MRISRLLPVLLLAGCAASDPSPAIAPDAGTLADVGGVGSPDAQLPGAPGDSAVDAADADLAAGGDATDGDAGPSDPWALPPCYRACDRVVECGIPACEGHDWPTAGLLFEGCFQSCDDAWAGSALSAGGCSDVLAQATARIPDFAAHCDSHPCSGACETLSSCIVEECPGVDGAAAPSLKASCLETCGPQDAAWIDRAGGCGAIVSAIAGADPGFAAACYPDGTACADAATCESYGEKLAGCLVERCDGHADPYEQGLRTVLSGYCATDPKCPSEQSVTALLSPAVTCESPALAALGDNPPFAALCHGEVDATPDEVVAACEALMPCPGAEWLTSKELCMAFLVMVDGATERIACLTDAGACSAVYACLEGL
jgi:hypothetical protein